MHLVQPHVNFGYDKNDEQSNIALRSKVDIGIKLAGEESFIWSDELMFETLFDLRVEQEVLVMRFFRMDLKA